MEFLFKWHFRKKKTGRPTNRTASGAWCRTRILNTNTRIIKVVLQFCSYSKASPHSSKPRLHSTCNSPLRNGHNYEYTLTARDSKSKSCGYENEYVWNLEHSPVWLLLNYYVKALKTTRKITKTNQQVADYDVPTIENHVLRSTGTKHEVFYSILNIIVFRIPRRHFLNIYRYSYSYRQ